MLKSFLIIIFIFSVTRCVSPKPLNEHSLAKVALHAAKKGGVHKDARGLLLEATKLYNQAEILLKEKKNKEAKELLKRVRKIAEKAENLSRLKAFQSGVTQP